jgi:hypothetical protein
VLGKNAPHPFQQDSLSQKIEWDGLTDGFKKAEATGCRVRVSLGLQPKFERSIGWDPYSILSYGTDTRVKEVSPVMMGTGPDGSRCVVDTVGQPEARLYDKDWKYLRTIFPPSSSDVGKVLGPSFKFNTTSWGDKAVCATWFGPVVGHPGDNRGAKTAQERWPDLFRALKEAGVTDVKEKVPFPQELTAKSTVSRPMVIRVMRTPGSNGARLAVDPVREELYASIGGSVFRFDGKTGAQDPTWFPNGEFEQGGELSFGPDGLLYVGRGGKATMTFRVGHDGKAVPWKAV